MKHLLLIFFCFWTSAQAQSDLLPPDEAFALKARVVDNNIVLTWDIAPNYYLYKEKIAISANHSKRLGAVQFPKAKIKNDEFFGIIGTYRNNISVRIPILAGEEKSILLNVSYQGCADIGVCYPPIDKSIPLQINHTATGVGASIKKTTFNLLNQASEQVSTLVGQFTSNNTHPLHPDEAFKFAASFIDKDTLLVSWNIEKDYYLYHDKFSFDVQGAEFGDIVFPDGKIKDDPLFGKVKIHKNQVAVSLPLKNIKTQNITLTAKYQGCWEGGVCYPPQEKNIKLNSAGQLGNTVNTDNSANKSTPILSPQNPQPNTLNAADKITASLQQDNILWVLLSFFGFGLLLSLTPCVFPMIPVLSGIIVGQKTAPSTKKALLMSVVFVLSVSITYAAAGVLAGYFGQNLTILFQTPWVLILFSLVFVALAFSMFGYYDIQLPSSLQTKIANASNQQKSGNLLGVAIMGVLSALIVGPCVAPPLAGALIYIGQTGDALLGGLSLFVLSLGMGVPLLLVGAGISKLPKAGGWMENIKVIFGVLMLAVAIYLLDRVVSPLSSLILWALLFTITPIAMGALEAVKTTWHRIFKAIGLIVLGYGILLFLLVARGGGGDMLQPLSELSGWGGTTNTQSQQKVIFKPVKSNAELNAILTTAKQHQQLVVLDFYADWCISCKEIEHFVFAKAAVVDAMQDVIALKADVTNNSADDKALMARFDVVGPPALLFFKNAKEARSLRIVGEISAPDFIQQLNQAR